MLSGFIVQIILSITASGFYHPDQHFQIIEFSSYQSGTLNAASRVHEFSIHIRPTLQVYLFTGWDFLINNAGIHNPYTEMTILRILLGILMFALFNLMVIFYFKDDRKYVLYTALLILNFSWFLPYIRTLYSSEMLSALSFFGAAFWYDLKKDKKPKAVFLFLVGLLFCFSFYFRFQTGFLLVGFGLWMIIFQKKISHIIPVALGFVAGALLNTWLDYEFYHKFVITPYDYYNFNIIQDKASTNFGTSSFLRYIGLLVAVITVPPLSIILFYYFTKTIRSNFRHWLFISTLLFIIGHCLVGHKEERFLFPVLCIMPIWIGWGLQAFYQYYFKTKGVLRCLIKTAVIFSVTLNLMLLVLLVLNPYSQSIHFTTLLNKKFNNSGPKTSIYCINRTPYETPAGNPAIFYNRYFKSPEFIRLNNIDTLKSLQGDKRYVTITFKQIKNDRIFMDSLGYKPVMYSSLLLWKINEFLHSKKLNIIEDIWVLYEKKSGTLNLSRNHTSVTEISTGIEK